MSSAGIADTSDPPSAIYTGSCHCGSFTYTVQQSPPLDHPSCEVKECNCSMCARNGYLFITPAEKNVKFTNGEKDEFKKYTFGKHIFAHYFCGTCGVSCMAQSLDPNLWADIVAVNVRTLQDVDLKSLNVKLADGKRL
ncbi:uncharacterized protein CC84DRAFT_586051 [Paraphaeosphaeria sporulosa]|uniref:CENP-V/GFA domain-containing protein n=1 Tax=Paraphaeosphaeria sporulosa TaxID=1460663 RepID=A0A177CPM7_9PLEO|nr:uncharacterized protein CC84DRAFT_586051 [Paraphaeosphaeria sporulosa]OAG08739.1 hypothetical protein CC84DRAFT_586051 [Paraphaeosphaeria sporulosa]